MREPLLGVPQPRVLQQQRLDRVDRGAGHLLLRRPVRVRPAAGRGTGQVGQVADHVVAALLDLLDPRRLDLLRPGVHVGRQREARRAGAVREGLVRQQLTDQRPVVRRVEHVVDRAVDPPQQRGLGDAQRRVGPLRLEVEVQAVQPERGAEPLPQQVPRPARRRDGDQVDPFRGQVVAPAVQDVGDLLHPPEPGGDPALPGGVPDLLEEPGVADDAAVLDVLLPLGRDLADQVAHRQDQVDLGVVVVAERGQRPAGLGAGGGRQDLVAHDRGAGPAAHVGGQPVPCADRLGLQAAPRQPHQVERGEEVGVEPVRGVANAGLGQASPVPEQHVLEVRRTRLGSADVQEDPLRHAFSSLFPSNLSASSSSRTASASTPGSEGSGTPDRSRGSSVSGSPCTA